MKETQQFMDTHILVSFSFEIDMHNIFHINLELEHLTFPLESENHFDREFFHNLKTMFSLKDQKRI